MKIFETYTGNAILNNALMTIEALGNLKSVSEITPDFLLQLYKDKSLLKLNKRLKSYTMLFTKNGPLHNDKVKGDKIYDALFKTIVKNFENEGETICEISGLRYNTSFYSVYEKALKSAGICKKEIQKKDKNLSRIWFPLIGGLGSDAQALPQAKFTVQIHPICVAILQFLPLSSLLYKGGILLIDSSNFEFARRYVTENQKVLHRRIQSTKSTKSIENVKDFSKGNYILKAIEILEQKKEYEEAYSDLNLWSFSNSGTGPSCEIDRVPNILLRKLIYLKHHSPGVGKELKDILNNTSSSYSFLNALENNTEWWLLYPNVFGSGRKKVEYDGVSVNFLEAFFKVIDCNKQTEYAKYIAYLLDKYKTNHFERYLNKIDAWNEKDYRIDLYTVLVEAAKNNEWDLPDQLQIIDDSEQVPVRNTFYKVHKLIHFYYQKKAWSTQLPELENKLSNVQAVCEWMIALIQRDKNRERLINNFTNAHEYISYPGLMLRSYKLSEVNLNTIVNALYNSEFFLNTSGLNELLRIFFSQPEQNIFEVPNLKISDELLKIDEATEKWFNDFETFSKDYQAYYFDKYKHRETGNKPYDKFKNLIQNISLESSQFLYWFYEAIERTNDFFEKNEDLPSERWTKDLLYNPKGEFSLPFVKLAIKFSLLKQISKGYARK